MPRIEVFSDFDGTISLEDTGCVLIDSGMGTEARKKMDVKILHHELTFLEAMDIWWAGVHLTWEQGLELLKPVRLDPGFLSFYDYSLKHQIPFSIVSCGLDIIIEEYMSWFLGKEQAKKLTILANYGTVQDRQWLVSYRDKSPHSHDKAVCIRESREKFLKEQELKKEGEKEEQVIVFCGDGISDLSAAREADILFARRGRDLEKYCRIHQIPFTAFDTFDQVTATIQGLQDGSLTMTMIHQRQREECQRPASPL